jgi:hypothetical protein
MCIRGPFAQEKGMWEGNSNLREATRVLGVGSCGLVVRKADISYCVYVCGCRAGTTGGQSIVWRSPVRRLWSERMSVSDPPRAPLKDTPGFKDCQRR